MIKYDENNVADEYEYACKTISILINNYSEIMRVPIDIGDMVRDSTMAVKTILTDKSNATWTIKVNQRDELVKKLLNLLTDIHLNDEEKFMRLKQVTNG
jgi:hypothetical protein